MDYSRHEKKVIEALCRLVECNLNVLRRVTGLNYYTLVRILNRLIARGLIVEKRLGRLRVISITESLRYACMDKSPSREYTYS